MWLSYGYMESNYIFESLPEPEFRSNFDITHAVSSGLTFSTQNLHLATGLNWRTGKPYTQPQQGNEVADGDVNFDEVNGATLSDYLRVDFSAIYRTKLSANTGLHAGVSVWNLLNRANTLNAYYQVDGTSNIQRLQQNSLGITPNFTLKFRFY